MRIDVKQAVAVALKFLDEVYSQKEISGVRLEEVELTDNDGLWHVTLSFISRATPGEIADSLSDSGTRRQFKVITISDIGVVRSMKIRELAVG